MFLQEILTTKKAKQINAYDKMVYRSYPALIKAIGRRHVNYNRTLKLLKQKEAKGEIFVIRPTSEITIGRLETDSEKLKQLYEAGYNDAKAYYEGLKRYLGL